MLRSVFLSFVFLSQSLTAQVSFEVSADARQVLQGSSFSVRFDLKNAEGSQFTPPSFEGFTVLSGPMRSIQTSIINGHRSSSIAYVYDVQTQKLGKFTIGAASIMANGKRLKTEPLSIEVLRAEPGSEDDKEVFILASLDKKEAYVGEQCILSYKLYTRVSIDNIEAASRPSMDAFHDQAVNMLNNPVQREIYNGRDFTTRTLYKTSLFPIRTGLITLEPAVYRIVKGNRDPFGFGMPSLFQQQLETVVSNSLELNVLELPKPVPEGFSGAVGEMFLKVNPIKNQYSTQDALKIHLEIIGNSNFLIIQSPNIIHDEKFEVSDSKKTEALKLTDEPEIVKSQSMDFLLIPRDTGSFSIIPWFCYFDPKEKSYKILSDSLSVEIVLGIGASKYTAGDELQLPPAKIMSIDRDSNFFSMNKLSWLICLLPISILAIGLYQKRSNRNRLSKQEKEAGQKISKDEFDQLEQLLLSYLKLEGRLDKNACNLVEVKVVLNRLKNEWPKAALFLEWIHRFERIKYSFSSNPEQQLELKSALDRLKHS